MMASQHTRTPSVSSEILITETVSSIQRCVCGNIFRSQRQLIRFAVCLGVFLLAVYMLAPTGKSRKLTPDSKPKASAAVRSVADDVKPESEYRATYFEEMGKRFAERKSLPSVHSSNALEPEISSRNSKPSDMRDDLQATADKVRKAAMTVSKCKEVPGLAVVMVKGDNTVKLPVGMADYGAKRSVSTETKFLLNSISKTFLGQLLAVLITERSGNITWDTRVADILGPDFQLATEELTKQVTLRDLLSHRSGLSSGNLAVRATYPVGKTRADLAKLFANLPPSAPFRKSFLYSNMASTLAAHVAETVGGAPWEQLMVNKLLAPLGMLSSLPVSSLTQINGDDFSRLYVPVEGRVELADTRIFNQGPLSAVSLLSTTPSDMAKWMQFNLRQGRLQNGSQLIDRDVWVAMWTKQTDLSPMFLAGVDKSGQQWPVQDTSQGYGLFWFINKYRGLTNFWHGGGLYSHYTLAWHFPEQDVAVYIVINGYSGDARPFSVVEALAYYATDLLLGYQPWLDEQSLCTYPNPWKKTGSAGPVNKTKEDSREQQLLIGAEENLQGKDAPSVLHDSKVKNASSESWSLHLTSDADSGLSYTQGKGSVAFNTALYEGLYSLPLFGNFSVFVNQSSGDLSCQMNLLTGLLHLIEGHTFGVELTNALRFLSKPSRNSLPHNAFKVTFVETAPSRIGAVDIHSSWAVEVPLRFQKIR